MVEAKKLCAEHYSFSLGCVQDAPKTNISDVGRGRSPSYSPGFSPDQVSEPSPPPHSPVATESLHSPVATELLPHEAESPQAASPTPSTPPHSLPERWPPLRVPATEALEPFRVYATPSPPYDYDTPAHEPYPQLSPRADRPHPSRPPNRPAGFNPQPSPLPQGFRRKYQQAVLRPGHYPAYSPPASPLACSRGSFKPYSPDFSPSSLALKHSSPVFNPCSPLPSQAFGPASEACRPSSPRFSPAYSPTSPAWQPSAAPPYNPTRIPLYSSALCQPEKQG